MEFIRNNIKIKPKINKKKKTNSTFDKKYGEMYNIFIKDTTNVELELKNVFLPFGIETEYNNLILKIDLDSTKSETKELIQTVKLLEKYIEKSISEMNGNKEYILVSQIKETKEEFNDLLICKIPQRNNKVRCYITDYGGYYKTIYDLKMKTRCKMNIYIDLLWIKDNKIYYKWKVNTIMIIT